MGEGEGHIKQCALDVLDIERGLLLGMFLKVEPIILWNAIIKYDSWQEMKMTKLLHVNQEIVTMFNHIVKKKWQINNHFFFCLVCGYLISMAKIICNLSWFCHQQKGNPLLAQDTADLFDSQLKSLLIFVNSMKQIPVYIPDTTYLVFDSRDPKVSYVAHFT
jgi:hypothetical protein